MSTTATVTQVSTHLTGAQLKEVKPGFGAVIYGIDLANGGTDEEFHFIQDAVTKYGFVFVRGTKLNDDTHVKFSRKFGELDDVKPYVKMGRKNRLKYDELFDVSNVEADGSIVDTESPRGQANKGNDYFHVDSSFNPRRAGYSLLLVHELPPAGNGGGIGFADTRTAWEDLDAVTKQELLEKDFITAHSIQHSKKLAAPEHYADIEPTDYPMGRHKLVQTHERSGRTNLYLAMHIHHIEGLDPAASQALFDRLFAHATQPKYTVEMDWRDVGDLLIWDNTCTMHRALGGPFLRKYRRDMRRATVHDDSSQAWGLNEHIDLRQGLP